ncbi:MAG TPA: gamma-glutamylcyclotransferase [Cyclobacteriaceae bacterium]|nr:gamma-glutamylcyclotransferase [Cyclobacteriaceae bacterium]
MAGTNLFAFYGSLRRGMVNFYNYQADLKYLKTRRIFGYELFALETYPYAVKSINESNSIVVEIFLIENTRAAEAIHKMEIDAGYIFELIEVDGEKVGIYLFEHSGGNSKVESGDWVEFFGTNRE